jgi:lysophospholipase L1-like esterase
MKPFLLILALISFLASCRKEMTENNTSMTTNGSGKIRLLALGDSYTIGHSVADDENFPNQAWHLLKNDSVDIVAPRIIATTGWTTDELENGIQTAHAIDPLTPPYDFVTLLIGVNNQYRGRSVEDYKPEFEDLLKKAIVYAGNKRNRVIVLSIPDWGVTPYAATSDRDKIAREIDLYNAANRQVAANYLVYYIDITPWTREALNDPSLLASDGLHPSGKEYNRWAEALTAYIKMQL